MFSQIWDFLPDLFPDKYRIVIRIIQVIILMILFLGIGKICCGTEKINLRGKIYYKNRNLCDNCTRLYPLNDANYAVDVTNGNYNIAEVPVKPDGSIHLVIDIKDSVRHIQHPVSKEIIENLTINSSGYYYYEIRLYD